MSHNKIMDHLFRHQYGKMVSILTRIFGLDYLETIEDAVQDTFVMAMLKWRNQVPDNPEAWLTQAAKNRAIDLLRKIKADTSRLTKLDSGPSVMALNDLFLEHEIEDSQLRMIFTACHQALHPKDQIAFALKTIAGFSTKEIASALLLKDETVKKRLSRARKVIKEQNIKFSLPDKRDTLDRLKSVHKVLYLIFNEGFHSNHPEVLIRKDLCGEAIRLTKLVLSNEMLRTGSGYALFGLMCLQASRLESKMSGVGEIIDLKNQDRSQWYFPLIRLGNEALHKAMSYDDHSIYHIEAAVAVEHLASSSFSSTNWTKILSLYKQLYNIQPSPLTLLNIAYVKLQLKKFDDVFKILEDVNALELEQRAYLYFGLKAEYLSQTGMIKEAIECIDQALGMVSNNVEKNYLLNKKSLLTKSK